MVSLGFAAPVSSMSEGSETLPALRPLPVYGAYMYTYIHSLARAHERMHPHARTSSMTYPGAVLFMISHRGVLEWPASLALLERAHPRSLRRFLSITMSIAIRSTFILPLASFFPSLSFSPFTFSVISSMRLSLSYYYLRFRFTLSTAAPRLLRRRTFV